MTMTYQHPAVNIKIKILIVSITKYKYNMNIFLHIVEVIVLIHWGTNNPLSQFKTISNMMCDCDLMVILKFG